MKLGLSAAIVLMGISSISLIAVASPLPEKTALSTIGDFNRKHSITLSGKVMGVQGDD